MAKRKRQKDDANRTQEVMETKAEGSEELTQESPANEGEVREEATEAADQRDLEKELQELKEEVHRLKDEVEDYKDRWMRAAAELDNVKKRASRDQADLMKFANERLLKEILPILDNLERALDHSREQENLKALVEGIEMIQRQFLAVLERFGVRPIDALNQPFDPSVHEAMMQVESEQHEPNIVIQELEKGYWLHDRLLRPSRVTVSKAPDKGDPSIESKPV
jgi:molecular chaperone GrpE